MNEKVLHVAANLALPINAVTQKMAVLGMTGSGKSYCMTRLAEEMLDARAQVVILDPKGEAWGLRLLADGKRAGYPIPVFGGEHGDLPLRPEMGARVVDLLVDGDYSAVVDVSEFISSELARFGYDFATRLFERKKQKPGAMCLMIDECQDFIPQNPQQSFKGQENYEPRMLHAFERVGKQLRSKGVGLVLATQRPQEVNKKVLNMCEVWFTFQMTGLQERETMEKIIKDADREEASRLKEILPNLEIGHAHVWSPRLLKVSAEYKILKKKTFDSSATPEVGARRVEPRTLSPVDTETLRASMQDVIEKDKANDPKELHKKIAALERQLRTQKVEPDAQTIERAVRLAVSQAEQEWKQRDAAVQKALTDYSERLEQIATIAGKNGHVALPPVPPPVKARAITTAPPAAPRNNSASQGSELSGGERRILTVLAQYPSGKSKREVSVLAGYKISGGGFNNILSALRTKGYLERSSDPLRATEVGMIALGSFEPLPTGQALIDYWHGKLTKAEREILDVLVEAYPDSLSKQDIAERTLSRYEASGGGFNNAISRLRTLELIQGRGELKAADVLFA